MFIPKPFVGPKVLHHNDGGTILHLEARQLLAGRLQASTSRDQAEARPCDKGEG